MSLKFKGGKLKFKESVAKPIYIPKKSRKQEDQEQEQQEDIIYPDKVISFEAKPGSGMLTTSGRTIHGNETHFRTQIQSGDTIIIQNPVFKTKQERTVTLIMSDKSILLEQAFIEEYSSFVSYFIKKKSKITPGENITQKYKKDLQQLEKTKSIKKQEMNVRLKKGFWSYETKKIQVGANLSRQEQLNVRQKMIKDKHCW